MRISPHFSTFLLLFFVTSTSSVVDAREASSSSSSSSVSASSKHAGGPWWRRRGSSNQEEEEEKVTSTNVDNTLLADDIICDDTIANIPEGLIVASEVTKVATSPSTFLLNKLCGGDDSPSDFVAANSAEDETEPADSISSESSSVVDDAMPSRDSSSSTTTTAAAAAISTPQKQEDYVPLLRDMDLLSEILANVVLQQQQENAKRIHDLYVQFRQQGLERAADPNDSEALERMIQMVQEDQLSATDALGIMRMFSIALNLVNACEVQHRIRALTSTSTRSHSVDDNNEISSNVALDGPLPSIEDSVRGAMETLLADTDQVITKDEIWEQLAHRQSVELVLTAHPTEVNRRTLLRKYRSVTETLAQLDQQEHSSSPSSYERSKALNTLQRLVSSLWGSDEIRRTKPTPQVEAAGGLAIIESVLWDAVPSYLRKLSDQCELSLGRPLPLESVPIKFASWIGGDRDGNPNVTPLVTQEVVTLQRIRAAKLYHRDFNDLYNDLIIASRFSDQMNELAAQVRNSHDVKEKYRRVIGHLRKRLSKTIEEQEAILVEMREHAALSSSSSSYGKRDNELMTDNDNLFRRFSAAAGHRRHATFEGGDKIRKTTTEDDDDDVQPIYETSELMETLRIMYDSLVETGFDTVANGLLSDMIRKVAVFGLTLVPLDIREESTRHTMALDGITRWLGIGSYKEWDEESRLSFLQAELANKRPLFKVRDLRTMGLDDKVVTTLETFLMASTLQPESLGAYVISQCQTASDVLAVMLLQKQFGMTPANNNMMRVVPLFETLDDLVSAPDRLTTLFSMPTYMGAIHGKQEVMVGYSDSAKDAGRLAACWAQYNSQERMVEVANKFGVEITFFHGKGGTVGRGGNPALFRAILSHPPNTINGRFRVTEQGEMITQNFGSCNIAERTLDIYTAAVCREAFATHVQPKDHWREEMQRISDRSCADYRHLVREEPRFVPYFRQATPELELSSLNIGSRPAKRNPKGGIESLRAIPWTFAWTQTRTHLSAWLGVGAGLTAESDEELVTLQEMYKEWPWFRETIDLVAMILSKTDFSISKNYDMQLVDKTEELMGLGEEVREKLVQTRRAVLDVTESENFGGSHIALLRASTIIRHPYVDPINVVQAELLKRLRRLNRKEQEQSSPLSDSEKEEKEILKDALIVSITGVAQGMRNSG